MLGLRKCYIDITSSQLSREQILQYWPPTRSLRRSRFPRSLDLWSLLDGDVLNWLGGEDKRGRRLLLAAQEVRLIIEAAAAALAAARVTGEDPIASTAGSRTTSPTMPPPPAPSMKATPTKDAMEQVLGFKGPCCIAARPAPAAGMAGQAVPAV